MINKLKILFRALTGEFIKIRAKILWKVELQCIRKRRTCPIDVSLTSYGWRVEKIVPYTILSILKQSVRPEKICLWLDKNKWNDSNLPLKIKNLRKFGLEVNYCDDIGPYTKLIPFLHKYPEKTVVTVDDDIYYSKSMIKELYLLHRKHPNSIITENFCYPEFMGGSLQPYKKWKEYHVVKKDQVFNSLLIFPQGFGGVLYPSRILGNEVKNETLFKRLSPYADDVWFYMVGLKRGVKKVYVKNSKTEYYLIDLFRQIRTRDRLHDINVGEDKNDLQIKAICRNFNINLESYE